MTLSTLPLFLAAWPPCACLDAQVLFKLDRNGEGQQIVLADLERNRDPAFAGWGHDLFVQLCIFSGCDFLRPLPGIGLRKAYQQLRRLKDFVKVSVFRWCVLWCACVGDRDGWRGAGQAGRRVEECRR